MNRQQIYNAGLYCRLSVDDLNAGESGSIQTQRAILTDYCKQNGLHIVDYYIDDGVSRTTFDREGFQRMISDVECGRINTVVTKDLSRFGRNYAEAGMYLDHFFVENGVRFIAAQDGGIPCARVLTSPCPCGISSTIFIPKCHKDIKRLNRLGSITYK